MLRTLLVLTTLPSCTYITQSEYEAQLLLRDDDQDGFTVGDGDCDDQNPDAYPGRAEIAYDGADNDCMGDGDLIDFDGDGFDDERFGGDDCRDQDPTVRPNASDPPYDGRDQDCGKNNDFDADGDGYMPDSIDEAEVAAYSAEWNVEIDRVYGDCDDFDDAVYPGAPGELPYDGVDTNCDGANDFDADSDGFPIPDDCLDMRDDDIDLAPADVYPGAKDPFYDGYDSDCGQDNDFDADGDGFVADGELAAFNAYNNLYGYDIVAGADDCDDTNPNVHPEAVEIVGDANDQNCDNRLNSGPWAAVPFDWQAPRSPRLVHTGSHFVLATTADELDDGINALDNVVTALVVDDLPTSPPAYTDRLTVLGPDAVEPLDAGLGLTATANGFAVGSVDARAADRTFSLLRTYDFDGTSFGLDTSALDSFDGLPFTAAATDVITVGTVQWIWSCGDQVLQATRGSDMATASAALTFEATGCVAHASGTSGTVCGPTACETFDFAPATPSLTSATNQPFSGFAFQRLQRHGDLVTGVGVTSGLTVFSPTTSVSYLNALSVSQAVAVEQDGTWLVALVEGSGPSARVRVGWADAGGASLVSATQPLELGQYIEPYPLEVALASTSNRLLVAATVGDDASGSPPDLVALMVLEPPP